MTDFATWLEEEIAKREWKQADLARKSGLSTGYLSKLFSRERRKPGASACVSIARAFDMDPGDVFLRAGIAPKSNVPGRDEMDEIERQILAAIHSTNTDFKQAVLNTIKTWLVLYNELKRNK